MTSTHRQRAAIGARADRVGDQRATLGAVPEALLGGQPRIAAGGCGGLAAATFPMCLALEGVSVMT